MSDIQMQTVTRNSVFEELDGHMNRMHRHHEPPPPYSAIDNTLSTPVTHLPPISTPVIHQTIIVQQTLKDEPIYCECPSCHKRTLTTVKFVNSHKTHMLAGFICGLTFWCFLCCLAAIPYTFSNFKKADHYCSNCNYYLGSYSKLYQYT